MDSRTYGRTDGGEECMEGRARGSDVDDGTCKCVSSRSGGVEVNKLVGFCAYVCVRVRVRVWF